MNEDRAREEISYIKRIIDDTRNIFIDNGLYYIIIGSLVVLGILATRLAVSVKSFFLVPWIWISVFILSFSAMILITVKNKVRKKIKTFAGKIQGAVWMSIFFMTMLFGILTLIKPKIQLEVSLAVISGILGIGYFINYSILRSPWMIIFSIGWWIGAAVLYFSPPYAGPVIIGIMVILFEIVPGIFLFSAWKKKKKVP